MKNRKKIKVEELIWYISEEEISGIEEELKINYQVKKITWKVMFKLLLMWMLEPWNNSLRALEWIYNSPEFSKLGGTWKHKTKHTTLSDRLINLDYKFFERIFDWLRKKFEFALEEKIWDAKFMLRKFDSTVVWMSEKLLKFWMKGWGKNGNYIKFTVWLWWKIPVKVNIYDENKASSEDVALWWTLMEEIYEKDAILIFDRWVQKRAIYQDLINKWSYFITRLKNKAKYTIIKERKVVEKHIWELDITKDLIVKLHSRKWKIMDDSLRLIIGKKWDEKILFITNLWDEHSISTITEIYKRRWDIEVFFRFIKQEFWFSHFLSRNKNWILSILYMTLIVSILVIIYKSINKIKWYREAKRIFLAEMKELLLIELTKAVWWDVNKLKKMYLRHYTYP